MNNPINPQQPQGQVINKLLQERLEQDAVRDPVDALADAEHLLQILQSIQSVLSDPAARYILTHRIREDLACKDLNTALTDVRLLVSAHRKRWEKTQEVCRDS